MKITETNKELVKTFIKILKNMGVRQETSEMICSMIKTKKQMDELVEWLKSNQDVKEMEILDKAQEIAELAHKQ